MNRIEKKIFIEKWKKLQNEVKFAIVNKLIFLIFFVVFRVELISVMKERYYSY